ncbi:hypothetical protein [Luteococcus peritonei]|uniref:Uncharacterized protein n=1 Tax=Luteococcus peritonei TaxID=88874 RepID=A0ABW4RRI0_9ACTN
MGVVGAALLVERAIEAVGHAPLLRLPSVLSSRLHSWELAGRS